MKKLLIVVFATSLLGSCASMIPANSVEIEPNKYRISTHGNSFTKRVKLQAKIDKKAVKLCGNNYTYKTARGLLETVKTPTYVNGSMMDVYSQKLTRVATCGPATP